MWIAGLESVDFKKKKKKATCSKKRHSAGETTAFQTPRSEATVGLNEHGLQQALSAEEAAAPASAVHCGCAHPPAKDHCHFIGTGPGAPAARGEKQLTAGCKAGMATHCLNDLPFMDTVGGKGRSEFPELGCVCLMGLVGKQVRSTVLEQ